jgi:hypothetical protein
MRTNQTQPPDNFGFYPGEESPGQSRLHEQGFDHWHWLARFLKGLFECQGLNPKANSQKCKRWNLLNPKARMPRLHWRERLTYKFV